MEVLRSLFYLDVSEHFAALRELKFVGELTRPALLAFPKLIGYGKGADDC
jgi:hypothetical protein